MGLETRFSNFTWAWKMVQKRNHKPRGLEGPGGAFNLGKKTEN